jgi:hypothetical protein
MRQLSKWEKRRQDRKDWINAISIAFLSIPGAGLFIIGFIKLLECCGIL